MLFSTRTVTRRNASRKARFSVSFREMTGCTALLRRLTLISGSAPRYFAFATVCRSSLPMIVAFERPYRNMRIRPITRPISAPCLAAPIQLRALTGCVGTPDSSTTVRIVEPTTNSATCG